MVTGKDAARAEDAIKYIIFLSDADKLFNLALGMYDFALVLMIAQHSQKVRSRSLCVTNGTERSGVNRIRKNIYRSCEIFVNSIRTSSDSGSTITSNDTRVRYRTSLVLDRTSSMRRSNI